SRDFTITIAGQLFLIHQTGTNCEYTIAADPPLARAAGGGGSLSIATGAACQWTASTFTRYFDLDTFVETETPTTWVHLGQTSGASATRRISSRRRSICLRPRCRHCRGRPAACRCRSR